MVISASCLAKAASCLRKVSSHNLFMSPTKLSISCNAVFMVDLLTGNLIWSAGETTDHDLQLPDMIFSIPAELRLLDLDGNGTTDRLYFGDMGGQLWRIDIINGETADEPKSTKDSVQVCLSPLIEHA